MGPALGLLSLALFMPRLRSRNLCPARRPDGASENPGTQRAAISSVTFDSCVCEDRTQTIAVAEAKAEAEVEDVSACIAVLVRREFCDSCVPPMIILNVGYIVSSIYPASM